MLTTLDGLTIITTADPRYEPIDPLPEGTARWSKATPPPAIHDEIVVKMNGLGKARVYGYYLIAGYLGLVVQLLDPPRWFKRQNPGVEFVGVYGSEIE